MRTIVAFALVLFSSCSSAPLVKEDEWDCVCDTEDSELVKYLREGECVLILDALGKPNIVCPQPALPANSSEAL